MELDNNKTYSQHTPSGGLKNSDSIGTINAIGVSTLHPEYNKRAKEWQTIEDCIDGEGSVKVKASEYLPRPSGMDESADGNLAYDSYINRAHFPDFTSKFLSGLTGITKINPPKLVLPKSMEYLIEDCDGDGTSFEVFFFQSVRLSLKTGRQLIFVDVDEKNNRLKLVRYSASELINWGVVNKIKNDKNLDFLVLREQVNNSDNIFSHEYEYQYRVLSTSNILDGSKNNSFVSAVFNEDGTIIGSGISTPNLMGSQFNGLPVVIIGSTDIGVDPDQIPLLGVSKCALQMYIKDADLSNAMFLTCNPTLCMSGVSRDDEGFGNGSMLVGSNIAITLEDPNARAYYTKTDASGLAEVRLAIKTYLEEAKHAGSALLSGDQKGVESGEALRIKAASTTASLSTVSQSVARGFQKVLRNAATWMKKDVNNVTVSVDSDYLDDMLTPEYIEQLMDLFEGNVVSHETTLKKLIEGRFLDETVDIEEEMKKVAEQKKQAMDDLIKQNDAMKVDPANDGSVQPNIEKDDNVDDKKSNTKDKDKSKDKK